jgi:hypothetical protein
MLTNLYDDFRSFQNGCFSFRPAGWFQVPADISHPAEVAADPERFMPWNYRQTLAELPAAA